MFKPEGIYAAMLTPVNQDLAPDEENLSQYTEMCIQKGVNGLFPVSSAGEFIHFTMEEKKRIIEIVVDQAQGRVPVLPGATDTHPAKCVELANFARAVGCQGVVICPPYFYPIPQELVKRHYEVILDKLPDFPVVLYNIPAFTTPIGYDIVETLSLLNNVVGIKDSSGSHVDLINFLDTARLAEADFHVLTGREETLLASLVVGAKGCMTVSAGIVPEIMSGIYRFYQQGNLQKALELQYLLLPLVREMSALPFPVGFKMALKARGIDVGPVLQPLPREQYSLYESAQEKISFLLNNILYDGENV